MKTISQNFSDKPPCKLNMHTFYLFLCQPQNSKFQIKGRNLHKINGIGTSW